jgi:hypothetical protein
MELFDLVKVIFEQNNKYENLKSYDKIKHNFMLNRFMSIQYPIQAQMFNRLGISSLGVSDSWRRVGRQYKRTPGWIFTKLKKNQKNQKLYTPSPEALTLFLQINQIGEREYKEALQFNPESVIDSLKSIEKQLTSSGSKE